MCGIIGILGDHEVAPLLVESLKRLEYRGYDSAGIATIQKGRLERRRAVGKLVNLSDLLVKDSLRGKSGIGHTRWATHGAPLVENCHPHRAGRVAVVHNGIIENYQSLREKLASLGVSYQTDTDTETIALLCDRYLSEGMSPRDAVEHTLAELEGAYALVFLFDEEEDLMIAARQGSPLAIGYGNGEMFVGSDAIALAPLTRQITYLEEGDCAEITRAGALIYDRAGNLANRPKEQIIADAVAVDKGAHKHFMIKEIHEQPRVLSTCIQTYIKDDQISPPEAIDFTQIDRLTMAACGSGYLACTVAKYWFEQIARLPVDIDIASEFRYRNPLISPNSMALFVSQSGETADTLAALRHTKGKAATIASLVNVPASSIARESDIALPIHAGVEICVASTKAFMNQLVVLLSLAYLAARQRNVIDRESERAFVHQLQSLPGLLAQALRLESQIKALSAKLYQSKDVLFLGRGVMYPLAHEGALKLKEISYIHAEAYASGELKHGPIALIDDKMPVVVLAPRDELFDKTISNMQEVMARQGKIILITDSAGAEIAAKDTLETLILPTVDPIFAPLIYTIPVQLLSYHVADFKGTDVDQPRNLAKSVTVE